MSKIKNMGFENELIIVDQQGIPVNFIGDKKCSAVLLDILKKDGYTNELANGSIAGELDACQLEIKNHGPKSSLTQAQDELLYLFTAVEDAVKEHGLYISPVVVPNQNYTPEHSGLVDRYAKIHDMLMRQGEDVRKGTNIAGLHMHIEENPDFTVHKIVSNAFHNFFVNEQYNTMMMSAERHNMYQKVVAALKDLGFVKTGYMPLHFDSDNMNDLLFDENNQLKFNYRYIQVKKMKNAYTTEIRTPDAATNAEQLIEYTTKTHDLITSII